jgi:RNA recognition motif-containing protein
MENIETNKLFVGNLHWHVRWQQLKEFFAQWGEVEYASVSLDRETRKSR